MTDQANAAATPEPEPILAPIAYVYASRSGTSGGHVVTVHRAGRQDEYLTCLCPGADFARPTAAQGCHAMIRTRAQRALELALDKLGADRAIVTETILKRAAREDTDG